MTKREAKKVAYRIAYRFVQQAVDGGGHEALNPLDQEKVDTALEDIAQTLWERSDLQVDGT